MIASISQLKAMVTTYVDIGDRNFLGYRPIENGVAQPYVFRTYNEIKADVVALAYIFN